MYGFLQVRRSDRNNFTLSRYFGALPLETESAGQRRRLVLDVLRFVDSTPFEVSKRLLRVVANAGKVDVRGYTPRGSTQTSLGGRSLGISRKKRYIFDT